ncbi:MAG: hypothetical protein NWE93_12340 [Candidatus Bathyarchaeota archaeon]|nr:hypothetical protein [Candidatus Bathyarchaeota archaeon]
MGDREITANTATDALLQKYWLAIILLVLAACAFVGGYLAVASALIFTFLVPGLIGYRFFCLKTHEVWAFVPVFSILVSVNLVYFMSLAFGYSSGVIVASFFVLAALYALVVYKKGEPIKPPSILKLGKIKKTSLLLFAVIFLISLSVLCYSIWRGNQWGIVVTGSNWQDTPYHFDIIESINNGNFPPQTPNYVGTPLTYHYFVDFHTALIEKLYGYLPTLMPVLNALFIVVFAGAIYALARPYSRKAAVIATVLAVFGWGFSYFGLFSALANGTFAPTTNYIYQFSQQFGLPSIYDNLLQQRPLLMGLPVFALVLALLRDTGDKNRLLLAGILTGLVFQFHNVAFFCCYVAFAAVLIFNVRKLNWGFLYFLIPSVFALPFIFSGGPSLSISVSSLFAVDYAVNPAIYYFLNLGIPFILAIISLVKPGQGYLKLTFLALFFIPNVLLMTPWDWDMYKFFIFAWVPIAVLSGSMLSKFMVSKPRKIIAATLVLLSIITTASVVIYNVGTDYTGVSWSEYDAGLWIKENTPQNSVFLTYYSIQSPPSMIAGRLRVSSYVYWPYGHGEPLSEVNGREQAIDGAYNGTESQLAAVVSQYNVSYIYVGTDELDKNNYPDCVSHFDGVGWLTQVYAQDGIYVYQVDTAHVPQ